MTSERAWDNFLTAADGRLPNTVPVALGADCAFIASALDMNVLDFFMYPDRWLNAYLTLTARFPEVVFLPGFWVEYGMAARTERVRSVGVLAARSGPGHPPAESTAGRLVSICRAPIHTADGLMALVVRRYWNLEQHGELPEPYRMRFVAARGPFTIATSRPRREPFLAALTDPDARKWSTTRSTIFTDTTIRFLQAQLGCLRDPMGDRPLMIRLG